MISGPIASALANKYSIRRVTIIGSIIASVAFFLSTFAPNLNVLIGTYGVLGGQYSITILSLKLQKLSLLALEFFAVSTKVTDRTFLPML